MGQEITSAGFTEADYQRFSQALQAETAELRHWFESGRFQDGEQTIGYELEACLVNSELQPADANQDFLQRLDMPEVVPELARCNVEFNGHAQHLLPDGLVNMQAELKDWLKRGRKVAKGLGLRLAMIGILPTLTEGSLGLDHISDSNRYRAIDRSLARQRGKPHVDIRINGRENYHGRFDSIMAESAATSFQIHVRLPVGTAHHWFNAGLAAAAPILAVGANSPYLFGRDLWAETRIPVFAQSVDTGQVHYVTLGRGYVQASIMELFDINASRFLPLLPEKLDGPGLPHVVLHNGTIWRWTRPILDASVPEQPHIRLEHRSLPSGPSLPDMLSNVALLLGLLKRLSQWSDISSQLPFDKARDNFYRAARHGMDAMLAWPGQGELSARELWQSTLLTETRLGLEELGVPAAQYEPHLEVAAARIERGLTGAGWQRAWVQRNGMDLRGLLESYLANQEGGQPVAQWTL